MNVFYLVPLLRETLITPFALIEESTVTIATESLKQFLNNGWLIAENF